ncbi:MAG: SMP-30/gluconolactonase/LRE family protein [Betaproteobacteria bacterium]
MSEAIDIADAHLVLDARATLAECPLWSPAEQKLYWVNISGCTINRFDPATGNNEHWPMPFEPGCISLAAGGGLIAALRDGFYRFSPADGRLEKIADTPYDVHCMRFNDGRCDSAGRFWAGAMYEPRTAERAAVYCLERGKVRTGWGPDENLGVKVSNGMAFTADGRYVFQSDTPNHVIYRFAFDSEKGAVSERREFARVPDNRADIAYGGRPDGAAIDCEGNYWSAQYEGRRVLRFSPEGKITGIVRVPAKRVTMVAFGGVDLRTMYITTAREGADDAELRGEPQAGGIFACVLNVAGRVEPQYMD